MLLDQFTRHGAPGRELIAQRKYILQDEKTSRDISFKLPFHQAASPGKTYNMSMVFQGDFASQADVTSQLSGTACPKCKHINPIADPDVDVIWCVLRR